MFLQDRRPLSESLIKCPLYRSDTNIVTYTDIGVRYMEVLVYSENAKSHCNQFDINLESFGEYPCILAA